MAEDISCKENWDKIKGQYPEITQAIENIKNKYGVSVESTETYLETARNIPQKLLPKFIEDMNKLNNLPKYDEVLQKMGGCAADSPDQQLPDLPNKPNGMARF